LDASLAWPDRDGQVAFVLGAGFSRAISTAMPLTDELGQAALDLLRDQLPPRLALTTLPDGLNFEAWLSQLASDQPYLHDADNAQNQTAFLLFSEAIATILGDRVIEVLETAYPEWLLRLVSTMHHSRATVITFNYDPLIECLVDTPTGILGDPNQYGQVWNGVSWTELSEVCRRGHPVTPDSPRLRSRLCGYSNSTALSIGTGNPATSRASASRGALCRGTSAIRTGTPRNSGDGPCQGACPSWSPRPP